MRLSSWTWDSLVPAVQSGTVDCVIAGQSITSERKQMVDFTFPYYYASIVCLTNGDSKYASAKGITDLAGASCTGHAVRQGSLSDQDG